MKKQFKRHISSLDAIFRFVSDVFTSSHIDQFYEPAIKLVTEELFTNLVKYNRKTTNDISITIEKKQQQLVVTFIDHGGDDFDITTVEEVDINKSLEERPVGGLGIHLVKKIADQLKYNYIDGESRITFVKNLE